MGILIITQFLLQSIMISSTDSKTLQDKGITQEQLESQLNRFRTGIPFMRISTAANVGNGIIRLDDAQQTDALYRWEKYLADGGEVIKMVPASGAASRMFKSLYAYVESALEAPEPGSDIEQLIDNIEHFAFYDDLNAKLQNLYNMTAKELIAMGRTKDVVSAIINPEGLNYGNLPKGLLKFHDYGADGQRTPLEEHLMEGVQTARNGEGAVNVHFTISPDHKEKFEELIKKVVPQLSAKTATEFRISTSVQKPSTDTIAVNPDNTPFRDGGKLVFRPGGHGALIENLNDLDSAVVFIKNIDNVVPDSHRGATIKYKKVLAGYLIEVHDRINKYMSDLESGNYSIEELREMVKFLHDTLNIRHEDMKHYDDSELALFVKNKLNRPLRVCGMVRNEGEPGGGPYIAYNPDGSTSPQILESTQIDLSKEENRELLQKASHFNPVDLVCYIKDFKGNKFNLPDYVDPDTCFISSKSLHGKALKALELPGLWNGAMSDWSTIFVEVPIETFNPVKTVNDLLRPAHQG